MGAWRLKIRWNSAENVQACWNTESQTSDGCEDRRESSLGEYSHVPREAALQKLKVGQKYSRAIIDLSSTNLALQTEVG
jgi:hypothetical protein